MKVSWTSSEAARVFRVGVSTVKRWTEDGELESIKTPGGHRRYTLEALHRFAALRAITPRELPPLEKAAIPPPADVTLFEALAKGNAAAIQQLVTPHVDSVSRRAAFLDRVVGDALREIGYRWERGELGVDQEHRASHMIAAALDRLRPPTRGDAKRAYLACPPDEWHDLPLRLVRLVLEWSDWQTEFAGACLPYDSALDAVRRSRPSLVGMSARAPDVFLSEHFARFVAKCDKLGARVVVGGDWARGGTRSETSYLRFRTLRGFERWLRSESRPN